MTRVVLGPSDPVLAQPVAVEGEPEQRDHRVSGDDAAVLGHGDGLVGGEREDADILTFAVHAMEPAGLRGVDLTDKDVDLLGHDARRRQEAHDVGEPPERETGLLDTFAAHSRLGVFAVVDDAGDGFQEPRRIGGRHGGDAELLDQDDPVVVGIVRQDGGGMAALEHLAHQGLAPTAGIEGVAQAPAVEPVVTLIAGLDVQHLVSLVVHHVVSLLRRTARLAFYLRPGNLTAGGVAMTEKIILDIDNATGMPARDVDDGLALALALASPEMDLLGCTTSAGNCRTEQSTAITLALLDLAGRGDIPVAAGRDDALLADNSASLAMLESRSQQLGAPWADMPALTEPTAAPSSKKAHEFIIDMVRRHPGEVTLVMEGSLTNLALALLVEPQIAPMIKAVFHMGGDIGEGWLAEQKDRGDNDLWRHVLRMNDRFDPHATEIAVRSGAPFTFVPASVCARVLLRPEHVERIATVGTAYHTYLAEASRHWVDLYLDQWSGLGAPMWDPLTLACAFAPDFCTYAPMHCDIKGLHAMDPVYLHAGPDTPQVNVAVAVDADRFEEFLAERLCRPPRP